MRYRNVFNIVSGVCKGYPIQSVPSGVQDLFEGEYAETKERFFSSVDLSKQILMDYLDGQIDSFDAVDALQDDAGCSYNEALKKVRETDTLIRIAASSRKRKKSKYKGTLVNNTFAEGPDGAPVTMSLESVSYTDQYDLVQINGRVESFHNLIILSNRNYKKVKSYIAQYFCGFISAYRTKHEDGTPVTLKENKDATGDLRYKLVGLGLGYIELEGSYEYSATLPENTPQENISAIGGGSEQNFLFFNKGTRFSNIEFIDICVNFCIAYKQDYVMVAAPFNLEEDLVDEKGQLLKTGYAYWYNQSRVSKNVGLFSEKTVDQYLARKAGNVLGGEQWKGDSWVYDKDGKKFTKGRSQFKRRKFGYVKAHFSLDVDFYGMTPSSFGGFLCLSRSYRENPESFWGKEAWQRIQQYRELGNNSLSNPSIGQKSNKSIHLFSSEEIKSHPSVRYMILWKRCPNDKKSIVKIDFNASLDSILFQTYTSGLRREPGPKIRNTGDNGRVTLRFDAPVGCTEADLGGKLDTGYVVERINDGLGLFPEGTLDGDFLERKIVQEIIYTQGERDKVVRDLSLRNGYQQYITDKLVDTRNISVSGDFSSSINLIFSAKGVSISDVDTLMAQTRGLDVGFVTAFTGRAEQLIVKKYSTDKRKKDRQTLEQQRITDLLWSEINRYNVQVVTVQGIYRRRKAVPESQPNLDPYYESEEKTFMLINYASGLSREAFIEWVFALGDAVDQFSVLVKPGKDLKLKGQLLMAEVGYELTIAGSVLKKGKLKKSLFEAWTTEVLKEKGKLEETAGGSKFLGKGEEFTFVGSSRITNMDFTHARGIPVPNVLLAKKINAHVLNYLWHREGRILLGNDFARYCVDHSPLDFSGSENSLGIL